MTTPHKHPTVSLPQAQSTPQDALLTLARTMLQLDKARQSAQALVKDLEGRNGALRGEVEAERMRANMFLRELEEISTLLECPQDVSLVECLREMLDARSADMVTVEVLQRENTELTRLMVTANTHLTATERQMGETQAALGEAESILHDILQSEPGAAIVARIRALIKPMVEGGRDVEG